jgi:hypothetical protein
MADIDQQFTNRLETPASVRDDEPEMTAWRSSQLRTAPTIDALHETWRRTWKTAC